MVEVRCMLKRQNYTCIQPCTRQRTYAGERVERGRFMTCLAQLAAAVSLIGAVAAHAAPNAEVEAVQMPAWIERDGQRSPLEVGALLRNDDQIETGAAARVLLRLSDGSTVRLGENARFRL